MKSLIGKVIGANLNALSLVAPKYAGKKGFDFFCYPMRGKLQSHHHAFFNSAAQAHFDFKQERIQIYQWGNGPRKILFLHGWQSHSFRWKKYIESYDKEKFTIYALDAPGHGLSTGKFLTVPYYSDVISAFLERVGKVDAVVSHSIGSFSAVYTFHARPDLSPQKLVLLAPPGQAEDFFTFYKTTLGLSGRASNYIRQHFERVVGNPPSYYATHKFVTGFDFPGLIIHDRGDADTHYTNSEKIHRAWRNSKLILTEGFGHNLRSEEVLREVTAFTTGTPEFVTH